MFKSFKVLLLSIFCFMSIYSDDNKPKALKVYCAIGIKNTFEKIAKDFMQQYDIVIESEFKGSGHLMGTLKLNPVGDLFISAESSYTTKLKEEGFIKETFPLAKMHPVIVVQKGNPKGVKGINDLMLKNIKVVTANPEAAAIGNTTKKILLQLNKWEPFEKNVIENGVFKPTVAEIANDIKMKIMDAGIIWDATALHPNYKNDLQIIEVEEFKAEIETVTLGVLSNCKNPTWALKFARFIHARDKGQKYFKEDSFQTIENADLWAEKPSLAIFSGGVNRTAIEKTIMDFQAREGVEILTTYNGCGILVTQIKAGSKPDAYFACDTSFMKEVKDKFEPAENLSQTKIVMIVKKGNPLQIKSLEDLIKPGIKIGMGHPEMAALGTLTKKLLESKGLYEKIKPNIASEAPGGDMIAAQFKAGSLDVGLVYEINVNSFKQDIDIININDEKAVAIQPYAISSLTNNHYLIERLLESIKNNNNLFTKAGFNYLPKIKSTEKFEK